MNSWTFHARDRTFCVDGVWYIFTHIGIPSFSSYTHFLNKTVVEGIFQLKNAPLSAFRSAQPFVISQDFAVSFV
jgi:hypothetical protein